MIVSYNLFSIILCCYLFCHTSLACDKDSKFPVDNQISELDETIPSIFLCRMCGLSQDDEGSFVDISSPYSLSVRNETIHFERKKKSVAVTIPVQKVRNPADVVFDIVTLKKSSCKGVGKVEIFYHIFISIIFHIYYPLLFSSLNLQFCCIQL